MVVNSPYIQIWPYFNTTLVMFRFYIFQSRHTILMSQKIINWIKSEMNNDEWYNIPGRGIEKYKNLIPELKKHNIELTFNNDFTKIKKTTWKNGKPI